MASRPPASILVAAAVAFVVAVADVADVLVSLLVLGEQTGRVAGTLARDVLLVVAGVFLLRRWPWALWTLGALFALTLLRLLAADEWHELLFNGLAAAGLVALLLPPGRRWCLDPAAKAG